MKAGISNSERIKEKNRKIVLKEKEEKEKKQKRKQESKKKVEIRKVEEEGPLREITVKIRLERIDIQEGITVEALLDSGTIELVMSLEFARKQRFRLKKIEKPIYVRNVDGLFNKERSIEHTVKVNIYY